ncbi:MAG TPA: DUF58 domain-containing protein [Myxococcota bacterium]|nr:DUF58 domain-containing protein [Myxococcota bacterium]
MDHPRNPRIAARPALTRRLAGWLRPPRALRPTRAGWLFFGIAIGVGFAALNTGNNLLYLVLSLMLAFLILSGVLSESSLRGIRVRRRLPRELYAGRENSIALEISNCQRRAAAFAVVVEDRQLQTAADSARHSRVFALRIGAGERLLRAYALRPERRGEFEFIEFRVFTRFPFGLFSKSLTLRSRERALVFPAFEPLAAPRDFGRPRAGGERVSAPAGSGADAIGLRGYAPGDALRRIHWRASLRRRALLVREVESEHDAEVEVRLRTRGARAGERFEHSVSCATAEVLALLDAGARVALRTDDDYIGPAAGARQRARLLAYLALVEPSAEAADGAWDERAAQSA